MRGRARRQVKHFKPEATVPGQARHRGFTIVEMLLVLMLIGILAMLGLPALNSVMSASRLAAGAQEVVNALESAQMKALTTGQKTRVSITPVDNTIYVRQYHTPADLIGGGATLAAADVESEVWEYMEHPLERGVDYVVDFNALPRFKGVYITWSDIHLFAPVYFSPSGAPSKAGAVHVYLGGRTMVVTLDGLSGKVTVSE